jgi:hypothetical protein
MSRFTILLLAVFLCATLLPAAPVPKAPKADDPLPSSALRLLWERQVQKELKMSAEQRIVFLDGLADLQEAYVKKLDDLENMPNPPDDAFGKFEREHRDGVMKLLSDVVKDMTDAQRSRLRQLDWRLRGAAAFTDPRVEKSLQLTDAQKRTASEQAERLTKELSRYFSGQIDGDVTKARGDLLALRKETLKQMDAALTAEQKTAWTAMLGDEPTGFKADELWLRLESEPPPVRLGPDPEK